MIITMDCGNSNIKIAVFDGDTIMQYARLATDLKKTSDEYGLQVLDVFRFAGISKDAIEGIIISSVVPPINYTMEHMCHTFFGINPLLVGPGTRTGMNILYENPREVGSDRIVTAVAAYEKYGGPIIVIDFGTATTFGAINDRGEFLGGAIMPGLRVSMEALVTNAAKLPRVEIEIPKNVIGRSTISNIQSGVVNGYVGAVNNIVSKMKQEMEGKIRVIATGGLSRLVAGNTDAIDIIDSTLTMQGLKIIYDRNVSNKKE